MGSVAKTYMANGLLIQYMVKCCAYPQILGSLSSYMILQPIPSEYTYKLSVLYISPEGT
jgi:hypothetical protein